LASATLDLRLPVVNFQWPVEPPRGRRGGQGRIEPGHLASGTAPNLCYFAPRADLYHVNPNRHGWTIALTAQLLLDCLIHAL
jgi:hypothetical protein